MRYSLRFRSLTLMVAGALALGMAGTAAAADGPDSGSTNLSVASSTGSTTGPGVFDSNGSGAVRSNDYNWVEAGYERLIPNGRGTAANAGYLSGSYNFWSPNPTGGAYAYGSVADGTFEGGPSGYTYNAGLGYHQQVTPGVDLLGEAGYVHQYIQGADLRGRPWNTGGYQVNVGARAALTQNLSALVKVGYQDGGRLIEDQTATVGLQYAITPAWSVTLADQYFHKEQANAYQMGARYSF